MGLTVRRKLYTISNIKFLVGSFKSFIFAEIYIVKNALYKCVLNS